ncbi:flagellar transcriptional regulator FlhD [Halomonas sp. PAR7]|nr:MULTISPECIES: flagellar transcriptional regulator FlhD [unclassified Halomonas]MDT0500531.1 flagellar transcriptional regulator FlhD [Halomonas sp. PAR7]MDT0511573.1 flagellar transcriptional regulator FlhD [Halomonas sp. LES1]MDT0590139.1 flagellar transcriptional regulator FlhD [Halomonas sp. PAR8]
MTSNSFCAEIQELNLTYLLLAQRLISDDRDEAMFRLKISSETADLIAGLDARQLSQLARTNQLLCHFGYESAEQLRQITDNPRPQGLASLHAALLMASTHHDEASGKSNE